MFWTKLLKTLSIFILIFGIISSVLCSFTLLKINSIILHLTIIVAGSFVTLIFVAFIMMLSEVSLNLFEIKNKVCNDKETKLN